MEITLLFVAVIALAGAGLLYCVHQAWRAGHEQAQRGYVDRLGQADANDQVARDAQRLEAIRIELDQLWDYLRQRRALRDAGQDPDNAQMRDPGTVERYWG